MKRLPSASTIGVPAISRATSATFGRLATSSDGNRLSTRKPESADSGNGSAPILRSLPRPLLGASIRPSQQQPPVERGIEEFARGTMVWQRTLLGPLSPRAAGFIPGD